MTAERSLLIAFSWFLILVVVAPSSAQTVYWTDIGSSKIQRLDISAGTGIEDLLALGQVTTPVDIALDLAGQDPGGGRGEPCQR